MPTECCSMLNLRIKGSQTVRLGVDNLNVGMPQQYLQRSFTSTCGSVTRPKVLTGLCHLSLRSSLISSPAAGRRTDGSYQDAACMWGFPNKRGMVLFYVGYTRGTLYKGYPCLGNTHVRGNKEEA